MKIAAVVVLFAIALWLGFVLPEQLLSSGVESFKGTRKSYAVDAYGASVSVYMNTSDHWYVTAAQVQTVGYCSTGEEGIKSKIKLYTVFGLPYGKVQISCGGTMFLERAKWWT